ncbi:MAG: hypothetical protein J6A55_03765 [Oscillospiraceae bacterium]|nr:hypothetical protein [Oscillospiraceae bacterium]
MMKFYDLTELMEVKIARGLYKPRELVGSPLDFAICHNCSPELAKQVFRELVDRALLTSSDGRNYFVTHNEKSIEKVRHELCERAARRYIVFASEMGVNKEEAVNCVVSL